MPLLLIALHPPTAEQHRRHRLGNRSAPARPEPQHGPRPLLLLGAADPVEPYSGRLQLQGDAGDDLEHRLRQGLDCEDRPKDGYSNALKKAKLATTPTRTPSH
jgi:hypothetical protein